MKLGLLADIHEHLDHLRVALDCFRAQGVDRVIVLGDVYMMGRQIRETIDLLQQAGAIGVWGNHDLGLCRSVSEKLREKYAGPVLDYMSALEPRFVLGDCHFSHVDAWLDPEDPLQIWWFGQKPNEPGAALKSFDAVAQRHLFVGHYHRWLLVTPEGMSSWNGAEPVALDSPRTFVVIHSVHDGHAGLFDTQTRVLTPLPLG